VKAFWLLKYRKPHGGKADPKEAERFTVSSTNDWRSA
jgi:hypothetical protein